MLIWTGVVWILQGESGWCELGTWKNYDPECGSTDDVLPSGVNESSLPRIGSSDMWHEWRTLTMTNWMPVTTGKMPKWPIMGFWRSELYEFVWRNRMKCTIFEHVWKKGLRTLLPRYLGIRIIGYEKKKDTAWERDTYNIIFVPEIQEHHPKIRIVQFQSLYI